MDTYLDNYDDPHNRQFLNTLRDGIVIVDSKNIIKFANISALNLLGYSEDKLLDKSFENIVQLQSKGKNLEGDESPIKKARVKKGIFTSSSESGLELTMARGDRSMLPVTLTVIPDRHEKDQSCMIVFHDSSSDEKVDRAKSEFIALVSHQLRTPINIISWYVEKLINERHGNLNASQKDYLNEVEKSNHRVTELVQAIVNVSRTDLNRLKHKHEKVVLDELIIRLSNDTRSLAIEKNITLDFHIHKKNLILSDSDQELIFVSLKNIILNSLRYTQSGGHVVFSTQEVKKKQLLHGYSVQTDGYVATVEDNGIGIPDEEKQYIFTKLFRASNVQALDVTGVGLGLYIAQNFIQELGGHIWFDSELRNGSTFYIFIPRE